MNGRHTITVLLAAACCGCAGDRLHALPPFGGPGGITIAPVEIDSSPTTAWVYIDGKYVGNTPLVYGLAYDSNTRYIEVIAEPLPDHPVQIRQTKHIRVPPIPNRLHFFMNNHDKPEDDG
jgi:hypothetical protein